ncbi:MAG: hypothetical protein ABIN89_14050 [Chitinophagaceae bacterium]
MDFTSAKLLRNRFSHLILYGVAGIILFIPIINKYFVSDDFIVLKRVCFDKTLWIQGFFRPLSDCSLYLNYLLGGFNPTGYNLLNILVHSINSYLLFIFCSKWQWVTEHHLQRSYAVMASVLFLTYPFHNEAIVWTLGRGASLASTFGIGALIIVVSGWNIKSKVFAASLCYLIGLMAYESIIMLPLLIFILLIQQKTSSREYFIWTLCLLITCIVYLLLRYYLSGAIFGAYGEGLLKTTWTNYPANVLKVMGRLIIPPIKNSNLFLIISVVVGLITISVVLIIFIKLRKRIYNKYFTLRLLSMFGCALVVPFLFAVSTRTSEGDRLLYFPSFFLCCYISFLLVRCIKKKSIRQIVFFCILLYNIVFLQLNNLNWFRAGVATHSIMQILKSDAVTNKIFIANLPNEINGAYIFRTGFKEALLINRIDTTKVVVLNRLSKEVSITLSGILKPIHKQSKLFIPPSLEIKTYGDASADNIKKPGITYFTLPVASKLYYWNRYRFVLLDIIPKGLDMEP